MAQAAWMDLGQLEEKRRSPEEELLLQSISKLEPPYWSGAKAMGDFIYAAFYFHEGESPGKRIVSAAFLLDGENFILAALQDKDGILRRMRGTGGGPQEMLEALFDGLLKRGRQKAEELGEFLMEVEREIVNGKIDRGRNRTIFECKRLLAVWKNDYEQILGLVEGIGGLGQALSEEAASYFRVCENKLKRLSGELQFLYEGLVHIREALDAALSYEQNRIMKVFTTVTTVFMPLTLIAGWYGMNFAWMPELKWRYGYAFAAALSLLVILLCLWFFKKKKLL